MRINVEVGYDENGERIVESLPAKFIVCPECEGHGTVLNPSMKEHCYTPEEFDETFSLDEQEEYFKRGGRYDVQCPNCKGKNVVLVVDEDACQEGANKVILDAHEKWSNELWLSRESDRKTMMGEMGCWGG